MGFGMAYGAPEMYEQVVLRSYASGTVTDATTYLGPFSTGPYNGFRLEFDLESETGTHTLDVELEYFSEANGEWTDWLDSAGTVLKLNNYADGETGRRFIEVRPDAAGGADVDKVLAVGNNTYYGQVPMPTWRAEVVRGGTGVSDVISASVYWLIV